jgi:hypothetical protein
MPVYCAGDLEDPTTFDKRSWFLKLEGLLRVRSDRRPVEKLEVFQAVTRPEVALDAPAVS